MRKLLYSIIILLLINSCNQDQHPTSFTTIKFINPEHSSEVTENVSINYELSTSESLDKVQLFINDELVSETSTPEEDNYSFRFKSNELENGKHRLFLRAIYRDQIADEDQIDVFVLNEKEHPIQNAISLINPENNAELSEVVRVSYDLTADNSNYIIQVLLNDVIVNEFIADKNGKKSFRFDTKTIENGRYMMSIRLVNGDDILDIDHVIITINNAKQLSDGFFTIDHQTNELFFIELNGNQNNLGVLDYEISRFSRLIYHQNKLIVSTIYNGEQVLLNIDLETLEIEELMAYPHINQSGIFGLASDGMTLYSHIERTGGAKGSLNTINLEDGSKIEYSELNDDLSILAISFLNQQLFAYSEWSDALYKYDIQVGNIFDPGTNKGVDFVQGMDQFDNNLYCLEAFGEFNRDNRVVVELDVANNRNKSLFTINGAFVGMAFPSSIE